MRLKFNLAALLAACWTVAAWAAPIGSDDVARAMGNWRHRHGTLGAKMGQAVKDVRKVANGEKAATESAAKAWEKRGLKGMGGHVGYHCHAGGHAFDLRDFKLFLDFCDTRL